MNTQSKLRFGSTPARFQRKIRSGLSVLEFIGCLMALVGGVWLGALYLGVDVRHMAYVALTDSALMDQMPQSWRPAQTASTKAPSAEELAASVKNELVALRHEVTALRDTKQAPAAPAQDAAKENKTTPTANTNDATKQATFDYWRRLNDVVHSQATLQKDAESAATNGNATKVAALKGRISRFSASAIRALPTANVDPAAVSVGQELATWYENGAGLFDAAVQIWESPAAGQGGQQATQQWEQAQLQHANEGRLLKDRIEAARNSLDRRFGEGFAPLTAF